MPRPGCLHVDLLVEPPRSCELLRFKAFTSDCGRSQAKTRQASFLDSGFALQVVAVLNHPLHSLGGTLFRLRRFRSARPGGASRSRAQSFPRAGPRVGRLAADPPAVVSRSDSNSVRSSSRFESSTCLAMKSCLTALNRTVALVRLRSGRFQAIAAAGFDIL